MASYEELRAKAQAAWQPFAEPRRPLIKVGVTTCSRVVGAGETLAAARAELAAPGGGGGPAGGGGGGAGGGGGRAGAPAPGRGVAAALAGVFRRAGAAADG